MAIGIAYLNLELNLQGAPRGAAKEEGGRP